MSENDLDNLFGDNPKPHDTQDEFIEQKEDIGVKNPPESNETLTTETKLSKSLPELNNNDHILSENDKLELLKMWEGNPENPPSIEELCEKIRPGKDYDGRSKLGREIKKYISSLDLSPPTTKTEYKKKPPIELTDEMREFIRNNPNLKTTEKACILFEKSFLPALSQEGRTILEYEKQLEKEGSYKKEIEDDDVVEFRPPKTLDHACARINKHVDGVDYDSKKLTPTHKKQCMALISYMHNMRFIHHMNLISNADDRKLFENTFVKYIYNKNDLSQEDLDQYLALANEAVTESSIKRTIAMLEQEQQRSLDETNKISMTIVEAIKTSRDEYNACRNRQDKLYKALELERSKRLNERVGPQFTLLSIIEEMKNEERRRILIEDAEKRNEKIKSEIQRFSSMDDRIVRIWGIDESLIIDG